MKKAGYLRSALSIGISKRRGLETGEIALWELRKVRYIYRDYV